MDTLNKNVKEINKPERMCICCRRKGQKNEFFRITEQDGKYVFDKEMKVQARGFMSVKRTNALKGFQNIKNITLKLNS